MTHFQKNIIVDIKYFSIIFFLWMPTIFLSQSIEITSFVDNPVEVNPFVGGNVTVNYKYSSETGSTGNHIYIGLEILDASNTYKSTITNIMLNNQSSGNDITGSVNFFIGSSNSLSENLPAGHYYQVKAILYASGGWTENAWAGHWNTPSLILQDKSGATPSTNSIAKGADVSWMTEMESEGFIWKDNAGDTKELLPLLKEYELNAIRLRVWVDPSVSGANGWCNISDFVAKAKLAKAQNMDILISIHYSDYWADPGKQNKPAAWTTMSVSQLETAIRNHTTDVLTALNAEGITPKWVQIGNETNDGMLWETGKASSNGFTNYAKFINAGNTAVKNFNNNIKTVVHLANGDDNAVFKWNIGGLINNGAVFDVIGMSLYPESNNWQTKVENAYANMLDMKSRYNKEIMMAEVGFDVNQQQIAHQFLTYIIEKTKQAEGLGVFYWEPIAHNNWKSYSKGAWDSDGSPSLAMDAFIDSSSLNIKDYNSEGDVKIFPNPSLETIKILLKNKVIYKVVIFDITGKVVLSKEINKNAEILDIKNLNRGVYFIKVNNLSNVKFIKK